MARLMFLLVASLVILTHSQAQIPESIVIFGDSVSDNGNVFAISGEPPSPPYFEGRFSNGPMWPDMIAEELGQPQLEIRNFAFGGAQIIGSGFSVGLPALIDEYEHIHSDGIPEGALTILFIGGNDYLSISDGADPDPVALISALENSIRRLIGLGGARFFLPNLPDLSVFPTTQGEPGAAQLPALIREHNAELLEMARQLEGEFPVQIHVYPLDRVFENIIETPGAFGFSNVTEPCLDGLTPCGDPDGYLFWDDTHPNAVAHEMLAQNFAYAILDSGLSEFWIIY